MEKELLTTAFTIKAITDIDDIFSKIEGRRNWVIKTYDNFVLFKGGFGEACRRCLLCDYIRDIAQHNIHIFFFTYKKDYLKALEQLKILGYRVN